MCVYTVILHVISIRNDFSVSSTSTLILFYIINMSFSFTGKITKSFCVKRNYLNLFTVSRDEVKVMHGMRFLTAVTIVGVHEFFYHVLCPIINSLDLDKVSLFLKYYAANLLTFALPSILSLNCFAC